MDARAKAFAEEAIRALGRGDAGSARTFISQAVEVEPRMHPLADGVYLGCAEIDSDAEVSTATWNTLADASPSAELQAVVEGSRP